MNAETDGLAGQAARAARWGLFAAFVVQLSTIVSTLVIARLLRRSDVGLVGRATIVQALFTVLGQGGFGTALISRGQDSQRRVSSTFWFATAVGLVLALAAAATSPWTARAVGSTEAAPIIALLGLQIPLSLSNSVLESIELRRMNHRIVYAAQIAEAFTTAIVPLGLAMAGYGPWAIVGSRLGGVVVTLVILLLFGTFRPSLEFALTEVRTDLRFNSTMLGNQLLAYVSKNLDYWVLTRVVTSGSFASYSIDFQMSPNIRQRASWLAGAVMFPVLAKVQRDRRLIRRAVLEFNLLIALVVLPVLITVALVARPAVLFALGPRWVEVAYPLQLLSIASSLDIIARVNAIVFIAIDRPEFISREQLIRILVLAVGLVAVPFTGTISTAAWAVLGSCIAGAGYTVVKLREEGIVGPFRLLRELFPVVVSCAGMVSVVSVSRSLTDRLDLLPRLLAIGSMAVVTYFAVLFGLFPAAASRAVARSRAMLRARSA